MIELTIDATNIKSTVRYLNKEWEFNGVIGKYIEFENSVAVMLSHPKGARFNNNVFIIYRDTAEICTIKNIVEADGEIYNDDWFTSIVAVNNKTLQLWAYKGIDFSIDLEKRSIVRQEYAR